MNMVGMDMETANTLVLMGAIVKLPPPGTSIGTPYKDARVYWLILGGDDKVHRLKIYKTDAMYHVPNGKADQYKVGVFGRRGSPVFPMHFQFGTGNEMLTWINEQVEKYRE